MTDKSAVMRDAQRHFLAGDLINMVQEWLEELPTECEWKGEDDWPSDVWEWVDPDHLVMVNEIPNGRRNGLAERMEKHIKQSEG